MRQIYLVLIIASFSFFNLGAQTSEIDINSSLDNTIFKDLSLSNGAGPYIFTGTTNKGVTRRALIQFDLTDVPAGTLVDSVVLTLKTVKLKPDSTIIMAYMVLTEWGEGTSIAEDGDGKGAPATAGDATWTHAKFPATPWIKNGGDYALEASATDTVSFGSDAVFNSLRLAVDVNYWLQNPSKNYGWILLGDERNNATSVKFGSKDNDDDLLLPVLKLYYQGTTSVKEADPRTEMQVMQAMNSGGLLVRNPNKPGSARIEIFSITGARLWTSSHELISGDNYFTTGNFDTGLYLYRISLNGISNSGKLLITYRP